MKCGKINTFPAVVGEAQPVVPHLCATAETAQHELVLLFDFGCVGVLCQTTRDGIVLSGVKRLHLFLPLPFPCGCTCMISSCPWGGKDWTIPLPPMGGSS